MVSTPAPLAQYTLPATGSTATPVGRLTVAPLVLRAPPPEPSRLAKEIVLPLALPFAQ